MVLVWGQKYWRKKRDRCLLRFMIGINSLSKCLWKVRFCCPNCGILHLLYSPKRMHPSPISPQLWSLQSNSRHCLVSPFSLVIYRCMCLSVSQIKKHWFWYTFLVWNHVWHFRTSPLHQYCQRMHVSIDCNNCGPSPLWQTRMLKAGVPG